MRLTLAQGACKSGAGAFALLVSCCACFVFIIYSLEVIGFSGTLPFPQPSLQPFAPPPSTLLGRSCLSCGRRIHSFRKSCGTRGHRWAARAIRVAADATQSLQKNRMWQGQHREPQEDRMDAWAPLGCACGRRSHSSHTTHYTPLITHRLSPLKWCVMSCVR